MKHEELTRATSILTFDPDLEYMRPGVAQPENLCESIIYWNKLPSQHDTPTQYCSMSDHRLRRWSNIEQHRVGVAC